MAETIRGITVVIGAETTGLSKALSDVNKRARDIQSELKQVEKLLKLDPKNTELLAQKQQLLNEAIENTREKLNRLRTAQQQVNEQFARGEISEGQYRAFQREVVKTEQELRSLEKQLKEMEPAVKSIGERMKEAGEKMKKAGENMSEAGEKLSKFVTAPLAAAGAGLVAVGAQFDDAFDKIRIGTGATGEALEGLLEDFRAVAREVPASFDDISTAIADYNTRLGLSGEALRELSAQTLELARITGTDLSKVIEETSQVFQAFNLPAEQYGAALDHIFKVSQSTGIGIERLESNMVRFAPAIKQLGIDFQSAATLLGQLDKAGVDVEQTLAGLQRAVATLAKQGITDANEAIQTLFEEIRSAPSDLEGTQKALEIFGTRAGPALASAIREGKLEYEALLAELTGSQETILGVAEETKDWAEGFAQLKNNLLLALEPLAGQFFGAVNDLIPLLEDLVGWITHLVEWFTNLPEGVQKTILVLAGLAAAIGPVLVVVGKTISLFGALMPVMTALTGPIGIVIAVVAALAAAALIVIKNWEPIKQFFKDLWDRVSQFFSDAWRRISDRTQQAWNDIRSRLSNIWNGIKATAESIWTSIREGIQRAIDWIKGLPDTLKNLGRDMIQGLVDGIKNMVGKVGDAVKSIADKVTGGLKNLLGISSPSRVLMGLGEDTAEGFVRGLERKIASIRREAAEMAAAVTGAFGGVSAPGMQVASAGAAAGGSVISFDGLFAGANFYVRSDEDIQRIARELYGMIRTAARGAV